MWSNCSWKKKIDKQEKYRADQGCMKEYMKKRRASADFRKRESQNSMQRYKILKQLGRKGNKLSQEGKWPTQNTKEKLTKSLKGNGKQRTQITYRKLQKKSSRRQKVKNPEQVWCQCGPTALLKQFLLTLVISSYKIADHSELISHTLATGLWRLLKHAIRTWMIYSHVVTCTW